VTDHISCDKCGAPLRTGARFCPGCGAPVEVAAPEPAPTTAPQPAAPTRPAVGAHPTPLWDIVIVVALLLAAAAGLALHTPQPSETRTGTEELASPSAPEPAPAEIPPAPTAPGAELLVSSTLARGVTGDKHPLDPTDTFPADTPAVYCVFELSDAPAGTTLRQVLLVLDPSTTPPGERMLSEGSHEAAGLLAPETNRGSLTIPRPEEGWRPGRYRIDLYINDSPAASLPFSVEAPAQAPQPVARPKPAPKPKAVAPKPPPVRTARVPSSPNDLPFFKGGKKGVGPVYDPAPIAVPGNLSLSDVKQVVLEAMRSRDWNPKEVGPGRIAGTLYLLNARAQIEVRYDSRSVSIRYRSSKEFGYKQRPGGPTISNLYNYAVWDLAYGIQEGLSW
jgi:hypothetical protein